MKKAVRRQAGFSIVELLIAMAISLILLAGVYQVFLGNTATYRVNENQARIQENGRFALDFLSREIRSAGYFGCVTNGVSSTLNNPTAFPYNFNREIEGFESTSTTAWSPAVDASIASPLGESDIITLRRINPNTTLRVNTSMDVNTDPIDIDPTPADNDILLINDCQEAWVFAVTGLNGSDEAEHSFTATPQPGIPGNALPAFTYGFAAGADVYMPETVTYYISNDDNGQPALFRFTLENGAEEILQGVANMQVLYGVDTDDDGDVEDYRTADNVTVTDWDEVLSVRLGLLVQTPDEIVDIDPDLNTYEVNGKEITAPGDRRQRRVFTTTIGLRNRLL